MFNRGMIEDDELMGDKLTFLLPEELLVCFE